jgi:hypothetical protein
MEDELNDLDETSLFFMKACFAQMESATEISKIIAEHSNKEDVEEDDIVAGLIYRLMTPMEDSEVTRSMGVIDDIITGDSSEEEEEEEDTVDTKEEDEKEDITEESSDTIKKVKQPICNCEICMRARICMINYHTYETDDPLGCIFKKAIEETCKEHNMVI